MGHNLGMSHDFNRKDSRGKNCYGYMDYKDDTNYWSRCSVEDFTKVNKRCIPLLQGGEGGTTTGIQGLYIYIYIYIYISNTKILNYFIFLIL